MLIEVTRKPTEYHIQTISEEEEATTDIEKYNQLSIGESIQGYIAEHNLLGLVLLLNR